MFGYEKIYESRTEMKALSIPLSPLLHSFWQRIKELVFYAAADVFSLSKSQPARSSSSFFFFLFSPPRLSSHFFSLSPANLLVTFFSSIFKQWNYSPLFFRVGVSAYPLMCQTNTWQVCLSCVIVPCLSDTKESCCWRAHLCLSCIIQCGICSIHTY